MMCNFIKYRRERGKRSRSVGFPLFFIGIQVIVLNLAFQIRTVKNVLLCFHSGINIRHFGNHEENRRDKCGGCLIIQIVFIDDNAGESRVDYKTRQCKIPGLLVKVVVKQDNISSLFRESC